jgi:CRP/FNR family transcriptional regulator
MTDIQKSLLPLFGKELTKEIIACGNFQEYREGKVIVDYDKYIKSMPIVISGVVKIFRRDEDGNEILLYYISNNESCSMAYSCCMEARKSEIKAVADTPVELLFIPHDKLDEWLIKYPVWKSYIFNSFTQRFNELLRSLESIAFQKLDERLIRYLKNKSEVTGSKVISLSHQQIADEMGTSRVVVSRMLKILENQKKLILYRNELKLLNL